MICGVFVDGKSAIGESGKYLGGAVALAIWAAVAGFKVQSQLLPLFGRTTSFVALLDGEQGPLLHAELLPGLKSKRMFRESRTAFRILPVSVTTCSVPEQFPLSALDARASATPLAPFPS